MPNWHITMQVLQQSYPCPKEFSYMLDASSGFSEVGSTWALMKLPYNTAEAEPAYNTKLAICVIIGYLLRMATTIWVRARTSHITLTSIFMTIMTVIYGILGCFAGVAAIVRVGDR